MDDWETGEAACIPLDPGASAQEQAEELYKKAGKLGRTAGNVEPLLQQVAEDWEYLLEVQSQVQMLQSEDRGDLQALREIQVRGTLGSIKRWNSEEDGLDSRDRIFCTQCFRQGSSSSPWSTEVGKSAELR